jgi:hypothetical protein
MNSIVALAPAAFSIVSGAFKTLTTRAVTAEGEPRAPVSAGRRGNMSVSLHIISEKLRPRGFYYWVANHTIFIELLAHSSSGPTHYDTRSICEKLFDCVE